MVKKPNSRDLDAKALVWRRVDPTGRRPGRMSLEFGWIRNYLYFNNNAQWFPLNGRIVQTSEFFGQEDADSGYSVNKLRQAIQRCAAKLLDINPQFRAIPDGDTIQHRNAARMSERVFEHLRRLTDDDENMLDATIDSAVCGSGFFRLAWDAMSGKPDRYYKSPEPGKWMPGVVLTPEQRTMLEDNGDYEDRSPGEVTCSTVSPFAFFHDWSARRGGIKSCAWVAERTYYDRDEIAARWGVDAEDLTPDEETHGATNLEEAVAMMGGVGASTMYGYTPPEDKVGERCLYVDMWERPSPLQRDGRRIVYAGGRILYDGPNPFAWDETGVLHLPYVKQDWGRAPGRFHGYSLAEDMISGAYNLNRIRSKKLDFVETHGFPATFIANNSGIDPQEMFVEAGRIYQVPQTHLASMKFTPPPAMPKEITEIGIDIERDLATTAANSEIEGSKLPGQMRSGDAMEAVARERDLPLNIPARSMLNATQARGTAMLLLAQHYYTQMRTARLIGENGEAMSISFRGADLIADLRIVGEPGVMDTTQAERARVLDMVQLGVFDTVNNPQDKRLVLKATLSNSDAELVRSHLQAEWKEERIIERIVADPVKWAQPRMDPSSGEQTSGFPVMDWEDHDIAAEVLVRFMYTNAFESLDPIAQSLIAMRWSQHTQFIQQAQMQQMQMLELAKGAPGQKGKASQPAAQGA